jgi:hypothetical protein
MGLSPMVEDVKPDSEICRLDYDSQLFRFSNILSVVCFISHVIQTRAMQNVFFRTNGPYFQNEIENVPFEKRQVKNSPHTAKFRPWKVETYIAFESIDKAQAFERYLKTGSGHEFARRHF